MPKMFSGVYDFPTLAVSLCAAGSKSGSLTPQSDLLIGKKVSAAMKQTLTGGSQFQGFWQKNTVSGGKYIGFQDTASSAGSDRANEIPSSFYVSWCEREEPVAIDNEVLDSAVSPHKVLSATEVATRDAVSRQLNQFGSDFYSGAPSSYSTDKWDNYVGLNTWLQDGNNICGVDRSSAANAEFRAQYTTTSYALSLNFLDAVCLEGVTAAVGGTTDPLFNKGSNANLWLTSNANYNKLKQEATARQLGHVVSGDKLPEGGMVGYLREHINYGGKIVVPDPKIAAGDLYGLDADTITLQFKAGKNFRMSKFVDLRELQPGTGQSDITTGALTTKGRLIVHEPWKNFYGTNVS
ncbi:MAG: hypothetical protein AAGI37_19705 [Planctomycetota bacterium]